MKKIPKHIAQYHQLYGLRHMLLSLGLLLTIKLFLIIYGFLSNFHFLFAPISKSIKYLISFDIFLTLIAFIVVISFFSKLKKFLSLYMVYCALLFGKILTTTFFIKLTAEYKILSFSSFSYALSFILILYIPYLLYGQRYRITFLRRVTKEELNHIHTRMLKVQSETEKLRQKIAKKISSPHKKDDNLMSQEKNSSSPFLPSDNHLNYIPKSYNKGLHAQILPGATQKIIARSDFVSPLQKEHFARRKSQSSAKILTFLEQAKKAQRSIFKNSKNSRGKTLAHFKNVKNAFGSRNLSKSDKRSGHYSAQYTHIQNYAHKPEHQSSHKPLRIFLEKIRKRKITTPTSQKSS